MNRREDGALAKLALALVVGTAAALWGLETAKGPPPPPVNLISGSDGDDRLGFAIDADRLEEVNQ